MPDFRLQITAIPDVANLVWVDPATATRPSRVEGRDDMQFRKVTADAGTEILIDAIRDGESAVEPDSVVGLFTMWPAEFPTVGGPPVQVITTPGTSAAQAFTLVNPGHYTIAVRHEDTNAGAGSNAGGAILFHIDVVPV